MLAMVTTVSLLVAIFAAGYMHGDPGYPRFFAAFSLFVFSMCMLVLVGNFLLLFVFWEGVGLCSYLLIGFWYRKPSGGRGGEEGVCRQSHRRLRFSAGHVSDLDDVSARSTSTTVLLNPERIGAVGGGAARARSRLICLLLFLGAWARAPSSRCTCGCRTRWKARRRSAR